MKRSIFIYLFFKYLYLLVCFSVDSFSINAAITISIVGEPIYLWFSVTCFLYSNSKKNDLVHRDNYFKDNFSYHCLRTSSMILASTNEMQTKIKYQWLKFNEL